MSHKFLLLAVVIVLVGTASCFPESRVVNGTATDVIKYPFMVSLRGGFGSHSCVSSIIAPRWILTAAHCVAGGSAKKMSIQYATTKISAKGENIVGVKRIIVHEDYELNASGGYMQNNLQEVNLKIQSYKECHARHLVDTAEDEICLGENVKGHCLGDSGVSLSEQKVLHRGSLYRCLYESFSLFRMDLQAYQLSFRTV